MKSSLKTLSLAAALVSLVTAEASAFGNFVTKIPTGQFGCATCHSNAAGGRGWNAFGIAVQARL